MNQLLATIQESGWSDSLSEPIDSDRARLAEDAVKAVRRANRNRDLARLRDQWPPAHAPLVPSLGERGQDIPALAFLDDGSLLARIGSPWSSGSTVRIEGEDVMPTALGFFGSSPTGSHIAVAEPDGVTIHDNSLSTPVAELPWPDDLATGVGSDAAPPITQVVPFSDGRRCVIVAEMGVWLLDEHGALRLLPTADELADLDSEIPFSLSMQHAGVSPDGSFIAVGSQDGPHLVFDPAGGLLAQIGQYSEYPHYALFSADSSMVALNSCHFYSGATVGVPTSILRGLRTEPYEPDDRFITLDENARVYAGVARGDEIIVGDASGYVIGIDLDGGVRWKQFIGSTVGSIALSHDGSRLAVSTYAGFVVIFDLDAGIQEPHQIGFGGQRDVRRWVFWRDEAMPLIW